MNRLTLTDPDRRLISGLRERLDRASAPEQTAADEVDLDAALERLRTVPPVVERRRWFGRRARR